MGRLNANRPKSDVFLLTDDPLMNLDLFGFAFLGFGNNYFQNTDFIICLDKKFWFPQQWDGS